MLKKISTTREQLDHGKNVALYFSSLSGKAGGAEKQLIYLAKNLSEKGHIVHIITWDNFSDVSFYEMPKNVCWHKLGTKNGPLKKFTHLLNLTQTLKQQKIKTLVGFVVANNKVVILGCLLSRTKLIAAERNGPTLYHIKYSFIGRWMCYFSLLACSRIILQFDTFKSGYPGFLHKKIDTIENPISSRDRLAVPGAPIKKPSKCCLLVDWTLPKTALHASKSIYKIC